MVPRFLFYATFYTSVTAALATMMLGTGHTDPYSLVLLVLLTSVCVVLWYESLKIWREQPFPEQED